MSIKSNFRIWDSENYCRIVEKTFYPKINYSLVFTVYLENKAVAIVTVNDYGTMKTEFLWHVFNAMNLKDVYFHQNGAPFQNALTFIGWFSVIHCEE